MIDTHQFDRVEDLFNFITPWEHGTNLNGYIFRGHSQESYELIPTALRPDNIDWFWKVCGLDRPIDQQFNWQFWQIHAEYQILRSFYRLADQRGLEVPISSRVRANLAQDFDILGLNTPNQNDSAWLPQDLLEIAALAQHYGIPTRLLDWTYDIYVALYFAFHGALDKEGNIVIWALNKEHLSFLKPTVNKVNVDFITPHYSGNPNLNAQKGLFTHWPFSLHSLYSEIQNFGSAPTPTDRRALDKLITEEIKTESGSVNIFQRLTLPCSEAKKGCKYLDKLGYDSARIFPGYKGVSSQLLQLHQYR